MVGRGDLSSSDSEAEAAFRQLVFCLVVTPNVSPEGFDQVFEHVEELVPNAPIFDRYCRVGVDLVRRGNLDVTAFQQIREDARQLGGDSLDYVTDLLRVVSAEFHDPNIEKAATEEHLRVLVAESFDLRRRTKADPENLYRARQAARRGLSILEESQVTIDPDIHGDLLMALGQTYTSPADYQLGHGMRLFIQAHELKERAGNEHDVEQLKELMRQMISYMQDRTILAANLAPVEGGIGEALEDAERAYEAAKLIGDVALIVNVGMTLAENHSRIHRETSTRAEEILREILAYPDLSPRQRIAVLVVLASTLSETGHMAEAREIQEELVADSDVPSLKDNMATLWMNLGNSRRETGDVTGARMAFETALRNLPTLAPETIPQQEGQIMALLGELDFIEGRPEEGAAKLENAEGIFSRMLLPGLTVLYFHSLAARCFFNADRFSEALHHIERAHVARHNQLVMSPTLSVWESMLQLWSNLDFQEVEIQLRRATEEAIKEGLIAAESAKGRLLTWLRYMDSPRDTKAPRAALARERHADALERVSTWVAGESGRRVISFFATPRGLGLFSIGADNVLAGKWFDDFQYDTFRSDYYDPWQSRLEEALQRHRRRGAWEVASALTEFLLDRIGGWLWQAFPDLEKGGSDLILIPHRLFRNLPLAHCRLPGGQRLSEVFRQVTLSPSLSDLPEALADDNRREFAGQGVTALVDSDHTLSLARLEGLIIAGPDNTVVGDDVTVDALSDRLRSGDIVLISCHGDFNRASPWRSVIKTADGAFMLYQLIDRSVHPGASMVVMGTCEVGRARSSTSDEPLGFPGLLVQGGVPIVIAPMWPVDDFASLVFLTRMYAQFDEGVSASEALYSTASWLCQRGAEEVLAYVAKLTDQMEVIRERQPHVIPPLVGDTLLRVKKWLQKLPNDSRPFRSPLYWAAFQVTGVPT